MGANEMPVKELTGAKRLGIFVHRLVIYSTWDVRHIDKVGNCLQIYCFVCMLIANVC